MELLQLKYFCDAAECENFSRTAEKFRVPTSNISQTVKRLECELGVQLFRRGANKISLSEEGRVFYDGVKRALSALDGACAGLAELNGEVRGEIKLLIRTHRRTTTLAIERFKNAYPSVQLSINHDMGTTYSDYSFIISDGADHREHYSKELLLKEKMMLAVPKSHRLAKLGQVDIASLAEEGFITMTQGSRLAELSLAICRSAGFSPRIVISAEDPYYVRKYVEMGLGIAIVPEVSWRGLFNENIAILDIGDFERQIYLFTINDKRLSRGEKIFAQMIKETFKNESEKTNEINKRHL